MMNKKILAGIAAVLVAFSIFFPQIFSGDTGHMLVGAEVMPGKIYPTIEGLTIARRAYVKCEPPSEFVSLFDEVSADVENLKSYGVETIILVMMGGNCSDNEYADFAADVAGQFPDVILEVWNEPDFPRNGDHYGGYENNPTGYAQRLSKAFVAIKRVNTQVVMFGSLGAARGDYIQAVIDAGGQFDVIGFHAYCSINQVPCAGKVTGFYNQVWSVTDKPVYLTEFNIINDGVCADKCERERYKFFNQVIAEAYDLGVEGVIAYALMDKPFWRNAGLLENGIPVLGLEKLYLDAEAYK